MIPFNIGVAGFGFRGALRYRSKLGAGLYHHLQASTRTEMLAGNEACNRNCIGKEGSCNRFVAELQRTRIERLHATEHYPCSDAL